MSEFFLFEIFDFHGLTNGTIVFNQAKKGREKNDW